MKLIRILMAMILVFVFAISTLSAETDYPGADKLKEFGLIQGHKGDLMVDNPLTRAEACVLLAELYGEKSEAQNYSKKSVYPDVSEREWYASYVNYAHNRKWFSGYPDGTFHPTDPITVQAWAKLMLTILDHFESWGNAVSDLKALGIRIYAVDSNQMKRGEAFDVMWAVVNHPVKGDTVSLGVKLGKLKPKDAEILSVETPSLKVLELKISGKLNKTSAENPQNYAFYDGEERRLAIRSVAYDLEADKISITFEDILKENTDLILTELGVLTEGDGNLLPGEFGIYRVKDTRAPEVLDVKSLGTKAIKVIFSEPIQSKEGELSKANDFVFDKQISVRRIFLTDDDTSAVIELLSPVSGSLSIYPQKSIRDYSGFSLMSNSKKYTVEMAPDASAFFIEEIVKASPVELVVKLSKNMTLSGRNIDGFVVGNRKADSGVRLKGDMLYLTFRTNYLPVGKSELVIKRGALIDYSGVSGVEAKKEIDIPADLEIPFAEGVTVEKQNRIRIRYNEPLKKSGSKLLSKTNYKLLQGDEDVSKLISTVNYDAVNYAIVLNLAKDLFGSYRLEVREALDLSGNDGASYYDFEVGDVTAPNPGKWSARLYNPGAADQFIIIRFDEAMSVDGSTSVLSPLNYMYGNTAFDNLDPEKLKINMMSNGDTVEIQYPGQRHGGMDFEVGGVHKLSIARVADIAGNKVEGFVNHLILEKNSTMQIEKAALVDSNVAVFEVRDEIYDFDERDIIFESAGKVLKGSYQEVTAADGVTKFRFVFDAAPTQSVTVKTKAGGSKNQYGDRFKNSSPLRVSDKIGPRLLSDEEKDDVTYNRSTGTVTLVFNEDLNSKVVSLLSFEIPGIRIEDINVFKNEIRIVIVKDDRDDVNLDTNIIQVLELRDLEGNVTSGIITKVNKLK